MRLPVAVALAALALSASPIAAQDAPVTAAEMRAEARAMAGDDPDLLAMIAADEAEATRGLLGGGPTSVRQRVPAGGSWSTTITRRPGEPLIVAVRRVGASPVSLALVDGAGKPLCADDSGAATLACRLAPGTGPVTARIANRGDSASDILLLMN